MTTTVYFVRHAHSVYNSEERTRPLSEEGRREAQKVTDLLRNTAIDQVISSPYLRAIQTVEGIAKTHGKEILVLEDLRERQLSGKPVDDFAQAIARVWKNPAFSWEGGESNDEARQRGAAAFKLLLERHSGETMVIGTHGNIMVLIMQHFDRQFGFEFWQSLTMPDIYRLSFEGEKLTDCSRIWSAD